MRAPIAMHNERTNQLFRVALLIATPSRASILINLLRCYKPSKQPTKHLVLHVASTV